MRLLAFCLRSTGLPSWRTLSAHARCARSVAASATLKCLRSQDEGKRRSFFFYFFLFSHGCIVLERKILRYPRGRCNRDSRLPGGGLSFFSPAEHRVFFLILGAVAFLFLALMAATSNDFAIRTLGRNWKRLQYVIYAALALVFVHAYNVGLFYFPNRLVPWILAALVVIVLALKWNIVKIPGSREKA